MSLELKHFPWLDISPDRKLKSVLDRRPRIIDPPGGQIKGNRPQIIVDRDDPLLGIKKNQVNACAHEKHPDTPIAWARELKKKRRDLFEHKAPCKPKIPLCRIGRIEKPF